MMNSEYFAEYITRLLNTGEKHFKVYPDIGELKSAVKRYGKKPIDFTSGVAEIVGSTLTPIKGVRLNSYTVQVTLYVDLAIDGFDEDMQSYNLMAIRDLLTTIIDGNNGLTEYVEYKGKSFSQTMSLSYPTTGIKTEVGFIDQCLPLYLVFNFVMFEDGINANDCKLFVNGELIPFTRAVFTRQKTAETSTFNGDISSKTIIQANGLSIDLVVPALKSSNFSQLVMKDLLNGSNYALNVKIETPIDNKIFIGTFGNTQGSLDIATNIGYNVSIVEAKENILQYDDKWQILKVQNNICEVTLEKNSVVYWGDKTIEELDAGTHSHQYNDNKTHIVRIFEV